MRNPKKPHLPRHVAVILDGNRRYAQKKGMSPWLGHKAGAQKLDKFLEWAKELGIQELTLYTFSIENFKRSKEEINALFKLFMAKFTSVAKDNRLMKEGIRVRFIGHLGLFPEELQKQMARLESKTAKNDKYTINFAMGYGGRSEIVDAMKNIAAKVKQNKLSIDSIDEELVMKNLSLGREPDMIIRTAGEKRLSNFLLYQAAYSELVFVEKLWPEFEKSDLVACIEEFSKRTRRFGK